MTPLDAIRQYFDANELTAEVGKPNSIGYRELAKRLGLKAWDVRQALKQIRRKDPIAQFKQATEADRLRQQLKDVIATKVGNQQYQDFIARVASTPQQTPAWVYTPKAGAPKQAMPIAHLSDTHFDEVVDPKQVNWLNAYSRRIAESRLKRFFEKTISLCDNYLRGVNYPGIVLMVSGDLFSGAIHEELRETNEAPLCDSLVHWRGPMAAGIKMFAERFGKVHIPWVVGNHPRGTPKPRAKGGVRENFDWCLGALLQQDFADDPRVSFLVSDSFDQSFRVYKTRYLLTHGDQFRGGSGIAAELSPMMIGDARKRERAQAANDPYDVLVCGHWHRRILLERVKVNGSLKGYDEYAYKSNFKYQPPMQSFWLDTPEHGITFEAPIFVKAENEGWERGIAIPVFEAA